MNIYLYIYLLILIKPIKFEAKKKLVSRTERVKSVELHPELPWVLLALYSGNIRIYDYSN